MVENMTTGRRIATTAAVSAAILVMGARGEIAGDRVMALPGYDGPLPDRHWSGYIPARKADNNATAYFHYHLVENARKDPNAPLVLWNNGGPGSSSLMGMMTENGPFALNDDSFRTAVYEEKGIPGVFDNPNSWHQYADMLYVEHPAPTGFSYCDKDDCGGYDDTTQSEVNYNFLVNFFAAYPEFAGKDFYMAGESYAGVLIPTVALQILKYKTASNANTAPWSLKGMALGNDCPGNRVYTCTPYSGWIGTKTSVDFYHGHGMISDATYKKVNEACDGQWETYEAPGEPCKSLLGDATQPLMEEAGGTYQMGGGYFLYDTCGADLEALSGAGKGVGIPPRSGAAAQPKQYNLNSGEYACGQERAAHVWLNLPEVQAALHVQLVGKASFDWTTVLNYSYTAHTLLPDYTATLVPNFRILQYSGDADPCVPYVGTQKWIDSLALPVKTHWKPWQAPGTMPVTGYHTTYDTPRGFAFVTVRNAGHMAPRHKPRESLYMFRKFLDGSMFEGRF